MNLFFLIFEKGFIYLEQFQVQSRSESKMQIFPLYLLPHTSMASPVSNISTRVVHLSQSMKLH